MAWFGLHGRDLSPTLFYVLLSDLILKQLWRWNNQYLNRQLWAVVSQKPHWHTTKISTLVLSYTQPQVKISAASNHGKACVRTNWNVSAISAGLQVSFKLMPTVKQHLRSQKNWITALLEYGRSYSVLFLVLDKNSEQAEVAGRKWKWLYHKPKVTLHSR